MNLKLKIKLSKVLAIMLVWIVVAILISIYDHLTIDSYYSKGFSDSYTYLENVTLSLLGAMIASIMGAPFLVFYVDERFRDRSYGASILAVTISFIIIVSIITVIMGLIVIPSYTGKPLSDPETRSEFVKYLTNPIHFKNILVWSIVVSLTQLFLQINNKFGHGILFDIIKGKYRHPKKEKRIFMFLDLKSSTSIAEKLGDETYHELLKDFYADITNPIIYNKGEIYQYVGDEVVISWKMDDGIEDSHCLKCYFDIRARINKLNEKYTQKYGLVPDFKAGIHCGDVIAGEIGIIKRDITYSGDILNTTARIQSKCNELHTKILASNDLISLLSNQNGYNFKPLGSIELRGKERKVELSTIL